MLKGSPKPQPFATFSVAVWQKTLKQKCASILIVLGSINIGVSPKFSQCSPAFLVPHLSQYRVYQTSASSCNISCSQNGPLRHFVAGRIDLRKSTLCSDLTRICLLRCKLQNVELKNCAMLRSKCEAEVNDVARIHKLRAHHTWHMIYQYIL